MHNIVPFPDVANSPDDYCVEPCYLHDTDSDVEPVSKRDDSETEEEVEEYWDITNEDILMDFNQDDSSQLDTHVGYDSQAPCDQSRLLMVILSFLLLWMAFY